MLLLLSHFSRVRLCATPSLGFSRQEHWTGSLFPSPMHKSEKWKWSRSVMSDSLRTPCSLPGSSVHGIFQARVLESWHSPPKTKRLSLIKGMCGAWASNMERCSSLYLVTGGRCYHQGLSLLWADRTAAFSRGCSRGDNLLVTGREPRKWISWHHFPFFQSSPTSVPSGWNQPETRGQGSHQESPWKSAFLGAEQGAQWIQGRGVGKKTENIHFMSSFMLLHSYGPSHCSQNTARFPSTQDFCTCFCPECSFTDPPPSHPGKCPFLRQVFSDQCPHSVVSCCTILFLS